MLYFEEKDIIRVQGRLEGYAHAANTTSGTFADIARACEMLGELWQEVDRLEHMTHASTVPWTKPAVREAVTKAIRKTAQAFIVPTYLEIDKVEAYIEIYLSNEGLK